MVVLSLALAWCVRGEEPIVSLPQCLLFSPWMWPLVPFSQTHVLGAIISSDSLLIGCSMVLPSQSSKDGPRTLQELWVVGAWASIDHSTSPARIEGNWTNMLRLGLQMPCA